MNKDLKNMTFFFRKKDFQFIPPQQILLKKKRKTYYANDLLALSLVSIIAYIYSYGKNFYCTYLKATGHEMILSYAKPFNEKICQ